MIGDTKLEDIVFPLSSLNLKAIPQLCQEALQRAKLEGQELHYVIIERDNEGQPQTSISVKGIRKSATLTADLQGQVKDFRVN